MSSKRIFGLDLLRAAAILFVVLSHGNPMLTNYISQESLDWFVFDGVTIFFVLSGFLIGGILIRQLDQGKTSWSDLLNFWKRRWFRTLPNYFLVLTLLMVYYYSMDRVKWDDAWPYYLFVQNFSSIHPAYFVEAWSLSIEEWFYLITPLWIWGLIRIIPSPRYSILAVAGLIIAGSVAVRWYRYDTGLIQGHFEWEHLLRKQVVTRLDSIMFGVIGAWLSFYLDGFRKKYAYPALIAGLLLFVLYKVWYMKALSFGLFGSVFSFWVISGSTLLMIPALSMWKSAKGRFSRFITFTSVISYSMYLIHLSGVYRIILKEPGWIEKSPLVSYAAYWILIYAIAWLIYRFYERPLTALRDRF